MNKKGYIVGIIAIIIVLLVGITLIRYMINIVPQQNNICKEQCVMNNLIYYKYIPKSYSNAVCQCKDKEGIIKVIYEE